MLYTPVSRPHPTQILSQAAAAAALGVLFAFLGLNWLSGCGQGGACITPLDLTASPASVQLAQAR